MHETRAHRSANRGFRTDTSVRKPIPTVNVAAEQAAALGGTMEGPQAQPQRGGEQMEGGAVADALRPDWYDLPDWMRIELMGVGPGGAGGGRL